MHSIESIDFRFAKWRRLMLHTLNVHVNFREETMNALNSGGVIVVCDEHRSLADGPVLAIASPWPMLFGITHKHAVQNIATSTGIALMQMLGLGTRVPLDAKRPFAMRALLKELRSGGIVMLFGEGRIVAPSEGPVGRKEGPAWLAKKSGAKIVKIRMRGNEDWRLFAPEGRRWRPRIEIDF